MTGASFYQDTNPSIASIQSLVDQAVAAEAAAAASANMAAAAVAGLVGGTGGTVFVTVNKTGTANSAYYQYQDGGSGRARHGLIGDDNWHLQVSGNGTTWVEALNVNSAGVMAGLTAIAGTNTTQLATTQFVQTAVSGLATTTSVNSALALKANLASPALTGVPTAPTASALTNSTQIATTSYTDQAVGVETTRATTAEALKAPLASPTFTGTPTLPTGTIATTQSPGDNTTKVATTAFAQNMQSPAFTGNPTAPTPALSDTTTKIATTAFVRTGVTDGSNAAAGVIGEYISSEVLVAGEVTCTTGVPVDITSISLTAGDWDVSGEFVFDLTGTNTRHQGWINTVSATIPTIPNKGGYCQVYLGGIASIGTGECRMRISVNTTTTVYLSVQEAFSGGTGKAYGFIGARRVR